MKVVKEYLSSSNWGSGDYGRGQGNIRTVPKTMESWKERYASTLDRQLR